MVRLTAEFWVQAYLTRLRLADIPAFVVARGDATAGAVLVKCATLDGRATAYQRRTDPRFQRLDPAAEGGLGHVPLLGGAGKVQGAAKADKVDQPIDVQPEHSCITSPKS